jgi:hypothetical protein
MSGGYLHEKMWEHELRNTILMAILAMWLAACASNETNESADESSKSTRSKASDEVVCTGVRERNRRGGSRLQRSCD